MISLSAVFSFQFHQSKEFRLNFYVSNKKLYEANSLKFHYTHFLIFILQVTKSAELFHKVRLIFTIEKL